MWEYTPYTDDQIESLRNPLIEGECNFRVIKVVEAFSMNGHPMLKLTLEVTDSAGNKDVLFDNLLNTPKSAWRLRDFSISIGDKSLYTDRKLCGSTILQKTGKLSIRHKTLPALPGKEEGVKITEVNRYLAP